MMICIFVKSLLWRNLFSGVVNKILLDSLHYHVVSAKCFSICYSLYVYFLRECLKLMRICLRLTIFLHALHCSDFIDCHNLRLNGISRMSKAAFIRKLIFFESICLMSHYVEGLRLMFSYLVYAPYFELLKAVARCNFSLVL